MSNGNPAEPLACVDARQVLEVEFNFSGKPTGTYFLRVREAGKPVIGLNDEIRVEIE